MLIIFIHFRFGRIVRCDIPAPRQGSSARSLYAFVEYEDWRAAEDAYNRLHGKPFGTGTIKLQWAKSGRRPDFDRDRRDYAPPPSRFVDPRDAERRATASEQPYRRSSRSPGQQRRTSRSPVAPRRSSRSPKYDSDIDMKEMGRQRDH